MATSSDSTILSLVPTSVLGQTFTFPGEELVEFKRPGGGTYSVLAKHARMGCTGSTVWAGSWKVVVQARRLEDGSAQFTFAAPDGVLEFKFVTPSDGTSFAGGTDWGVCKAGVTVVDGNGEAQTLVVNERDNYEISLRAPATTTGLDDKKSALTAELAACKDALRAALAQADVDKASTAALIAAAVAAKVELAAHKAAAAASAAANEGQLLATLALESRRSRRRTDSEAATAALLDAKACSLQGQLVLADGKLAASKAKLAALKSTAAASVRDNAVLIAGQLLTDAIADAKAAKSAAAAATARADGFIGDLKTLTACIASSEAARAALVSEVAVLKGAAAAAAATRGDDEEYISTIEVSLGATENDLAKLSDAHVDTEAKLAALRGALSATAAENAALRAGSLGAAAGCGGGSASFAASAADPVRASRRSSFRAGAAAKAAAATRTDEKPLSEQLAELTALGAKMYAKLGQSMFADEDSD